MLERHFKPRPLGVEVVGLESAWGRVLARDVAAPIDVPQFDRAAFDGYAVRSSDVAGADEHRPVELRVIGRVEAGEVPSFEVGPGEAAEVATGALIPRGADAVVMVEYAREEEGRVEVYRSVAPGENVYKAGSDVALGEVVLRRGTVLGYREIGVLASLGIERIEVYVRPRVAVVSTGNELVRPGAELELGKVYDVNTYSLSAAIRESGGVPIPMGVVPDEPSRIREVLERALEECDVVVTSGSTSAGAGDVMYELLDELGEPGVLVHGLKVKPGKPTIIAVCRGKPVFGLPGYPLSALIAYKVVADPVIRGISGYPRERKARVRARISASFVPERGRVNLVPVSLVARGRELYAYPLVKGSGAISSLLLADGFVVVPEDVAFVERGDVYEVLLFSARFRVPELYVIGSHCLGLELLLELLRERHGVEYRAVSAGSTGGLLALRRGEADVAGIHLLDEETGLYNVTFVKKLGLAGEVVLVRGYLREQGIAVPKGNPRGVRSLRDVVEKGLTFVNRTRGSGTRVLVDMHFKKIAEEMGIGFEELTKSIKGYTVEAKTHTAVAAAVRYGRADVGVCIRAAAEIYDLDFIPLGWEEYDFAVRKDSLELEPVAKFLEVLRSEDFKERLSRIPGYRATEDTGKIVRLETACNK